MIEYSIKILQYHLLHIPKRKFVLGKGESVAVKNMPAFQSSGAGKGEYGEVKGAAKRFRDEVLAVAGGQPEMKTLTDYLGGASRTELYFRWMGV